MKKRAKIAVVLIVGLTLSFGAVGILTHDTWSARRVSVVNSTPAPTPPQTCFSDTIKAPDVIAEVNKRRVDNGLSPLAENPLLTNAAQLKANDMVTKHYWAHNSPDGTTPWYWINLSGYKYKAAAENLGTDFHSTDRLVLGWMSSEGHRDNILNPNLSETGVAVLCGVTDKQTTIVVQEFGSR